MRLSLLLGAGALVMASAVLADEPEVLSGPQPGEKLTPFTVRGVFGDASGTNIELAPDDHRGPTVLVFIHQTTRPALAISRLISKFSASRVEYKLQAAVIFLTDDVNATETWMHSAEKALPAEAAVGISPDGIEGPAAYQLNQKAALTVLVANDQKVTANFALLDPDVSMDLPEILQAIAEVTGGGEVPPIEVLTGDGGRLGGNGVRALLAPLLDKEASVAEVQKAAERLEQEMTERERLRRRVGSVCKAIVESGRIEDYGTPAAQEYLKNWAEKYGPPEQD